MNKIIQQSVGIDCAMDELVCSIMTENENRQTVVLSSKTMKNTDKGFVVLLKWMKKLILADAPVSIVIEATGVYHEKAALFLHSNGMDVKVFGTHFNINAYNDNDIIKTTLLEGAVLVTKGNAKLLLQPGNQAQLNNYGEIKLLEKADIEEAVAWKNGYFFFKKTSLQTVMLQLSRWYDVDVMYEGTIPERYFGGEISRNLNMSQILQILDKSKVHFKVEGKKITVKPY